MTNKQLARRIETIKKRIAKDRDVLRDLIADAQELEDSANDAIDSLEYAADVLSRLV